MSDVVLIDTGPLVALLNGHESMHARTVAALERLPTPLLTTEPVLTEATFLLRRIPRGSHQLLSLIESGLLRVPFVLEPEVARVNQLMSKYANVPMSLADASLVVLLEMIRGRLFTFDSDFDIYRIGRNRSIHRVEY